MSIIKLAPDANLRNGKHGGSCVQQSGQGLSVKNNAHGRLYRSMAQLDYKSFLLYAAKAWRALNPATRYLWNSWAATYPQPTLKDNTVFLTGYELFVKRNYYLYLSYRATFVFMTNPAFVEHSEEVLTPIVQVDETKIEISCSFALNTGLWDCLLFVSREKSPGLSFASSSYRFVGSLYSVDQTVDITELYLSNFGVLPVVGESIFVSVVMCGRDNGQFSFHNLYNLFVQSTVPPFSNIAWGILLNHFVIQDARGYYPAGWHVATQADYQAASTALGGVSVAGGHMKESGNVYWVSNLYADNSSLFYGRASGYRSYFNGSFINFRSTAYFWTSTPYIGVFKWDAILQNTSASIIINNNHQRNGYSVRWVKNDNNMVDYVQDVEDNVYKPVRIGSLIWTDRSSICKSYNDLSPITQITSDADWMAATSGAWTYANGDPSTQ